MPTTEITGILATTNTKGTHSYANINRYFETNRLS